MYICDQFDNEDINDVPDIDKEYFCAMHYDYNVNVSNKFKSSGFTLLMKLVLLTKRNKDAINLIQDLLNKNPNIINQRNTEGFTAFMLAAANSYECSTENTVKMLIDAGADVNLQNKYGGTALGFAIIDNNRCINKTTINMIIDAGANINLQNNDGRTVLMCAAMYRMYDIIEMLIDAGADPSLRDKNDRTALELVQHMGNYGKNIIKLLTDEEMFHVNLQYVKG